MPSLATLSLHSLVQVASPLARILGFEAKINTSVLKNLYWRLGLIAKGCEPLAVAAPHLVEGAVQILNPPEYRNREVQQDTGSIGYCFFSYH